MYELIGITVTANEEGPETGDETYTYESPWAGEPGSMASYLPESAWMCLSVSDDPYIEGRINVNQARREVLLGVPGMTEELVDEILAARAVDSKTGEPSPELQEQRATAGWLVTEGLVELETMRLLDPFLTSRGAVFRMQVIGHFDAGGPFTRLEAVIDATGELPKVTFARDLTQLGKGYSYQVLIPD